MTKKIKLFRRLHEGIYKSSGGGETTLIQEWTLGPRNLGSAFSALRKLKSDSVRSFGNVGCGSSWLQIDDTKIHWEWVLIYKKDTATEMFSEFIKHFNDGSLFALLKEVA